LIQQSGEVVADWGYTYSDFLAAAMLRRVSFDEHQLLQAFTNLDIEHKGHLTKSDILNVLGRTGIDEKLDELFTQIDYDGSGTIDYLEFVRFLRKELLRLKVTPLQQFQQVSVTQ